MLCWHRNAGSGPLRIRWTVIALVLSLALNVGLVGLIGYQTIDSAHLQSDQASTWRYITAERLQLQAMRGQFCGNSSSPTRQELLAWESESRPAERLGEPYDKDGLLWLRDVGVKLDDGDRLVGVCPYMTWQALDNPSSDALDNAGASCPLEPLC